jgi:hypothetical protein
MVNNSTNINKTNNQLSPNIIEYKNKATTCDFGNPDPDWQTGTTMWWG